MRIVQYRIHGYPGRRGKLVKLITDDQRKALDYQKRGHQVDSRTVTADTYGRHRSPSAWRQKQ